MLLDDPNKFAVGDTVRVSNVPGPRMVVTTIEAEGRDDCKVRCMWFDRRMELRSWAFHPCFLSKASPWIDRPPVPYFSGSADHQHEEQADAGD